MAINYSLQIDELWQKVYLAVIVIRPDSVFSVGETYNSLVWNDEVNAKPTESEFDSAVLDFHQKYDEKQYARDRKTEYPTTQELVVALYDLDDKSAVEAKRAEVKAKYPKPE